jgi:hypothetical protein
MENEQELSEEQRNQIAAQKITEAKIQTRGLLTQVPVHTVGAGFVGEGGGSMAANLMQAEEYFQKVLDKHQK